MAAAPSLWKRDYTDEEIEWMSERVRYYIRKGIQTVYALDRAKADLQKLRP